MAIDDYEYNLSQSFNDASAIDQTVTDLEGIHAQFPIISREGMRKAYTKANSYRKDDRLKKSKDQVDILNHMFRMTGGKLDRR